MKLFIVPRDEHDLIKSFAVMGYYALKGYRVNWWWGYGMVYCFDSIIEAVESVADVVEKFMLEKDDIVFALEVGEDKYLYIDVCDVANYVADVYNEQTYITDLCDIKWIQFPG